MLHRNAKLGMWIIVLLFIFVILQFVLGDTIGLIQDNRCFVLLGCNAGFFGYDALVHFLAGIIFALLVVWIGEAYPKLRVISKNFWKSAVIVIAICALIETGWETWEFSIDHIRMNVLHQDIVSTNQLLQPSNSDTMGDEVFNLIGGIVGIALLAKYKPGSLTESEPSDIGENRVGDEDTRT